MSISHRLGLAGAGLAALLLAAACAGPAAEPTSKPAAPTAASAPNVAGVQDVTITARDIAFPQKQFMLQAGVPARLTFVNEGAIEHDVTIPGLAAGAAADAHGHEAAGHSMGALAPGTVHATARPGDRAVVEFTPKAGTYTFACSLPGHKEAGMQGTLAVK